MKFRLLSLLLMVFCASLLAGQTIPAGTKSKQRFHFSDIPFWFGDQTLEDHPDDSLFTDPKTRDIVVARPAITPPPLPSIRY